MNNILEKFGLTGKISVSLLSSGHINKTYLCECDSRKYILQSLNRDIFRKSEIVMRNISAVEAAFEKYSDEMVSVPHYLCCEGRNYIKHNDEIWRIYEYTEGNSGYSPYLHGFAVGRFLKIVNSCEISLETVLNLHNFGDMGLPLRNIHGDTKADNIIFGERLTVIDLDTAMRGYICADYGDMIRSVTADKFSLTAVHEATKGFAEGLGGLLTAEEIDSLYSGIVRIISELAERYSGEQKNFPNKTAEQCLARERELKSQLKDINQNEKEIRRIIDKCFEK